MKQSFSWILTSHIVHEVVLLSYNHLILIFLIGFMPCDNGTKNQ
jgi:hypothetical protein